jgi:hypothetical protein
MTTTFTLDGLQTANEQNGSHGNPFAKNKKRNKIKQLAAFSTKAHFKLTALITVKLTRVGAGEMDDDGLRAALKSVRDGIASAFRIDDGSKLIRWEYEQRRCPRGEYAVEVAITV